VLMELMSGLARLGWLWSRLGNTEGGRYADKESDAGVIAELLQSYSQSAIKTIRESVSCALCRGGFADYNLCRGQNNR
jgi:hypothetical protein